VSNSFPCVHILIDETIQDNTADYRSTPTMSIVM
jgi:hypothetical protein